MIVPAFKCESVAVVGHDDADGAAVGVHVHRDARGLAVLQRVHHRFVHHRGDRLLVIAGDPRLRRHPNRHRHLPFHGDALAYAGQGIVERTRRGPDRCGLEPVDEEPQLALFDGQRPFDRQEPVARRLHGIGGGQRLQLEADAGERLQHAVVKVARYAEALLTGGQAALAPRRERLIDGRANLARDHFGQGNHFRRRRARLGEEDAATDAVGLERRGDDAE